MLIILPEEMHLICKIEYGILIYRIKGGGNMEFLYKLYSNNYFGIGLFIVITVLAFTFLIILFFGKRDQKVREEQALQKKKIESVSVKEETEQAVELNTVEPITLNEEVTANIEPSREEIEPISIEEPETEEEIEIFKEKPMEEMDPFVTSNIVLNTDYIEERAIVDEVQESYPNSTSDIYNLDSIINDDVVTVTDDESIDDVLNKYDAIEETMIKEQPSVINSVENRVEANPVNSDESDLNVFESPSESLKKSSSPFSSVYLTKEEAETKTEEPVIEPTPVTQSPLRRTNFEMPKRMDLPKRSASAINESIISSMSTENNATSPFDNFEEDSYNIKK